MFFYLLLYIMIKYKLKWVYITYSEKFKRDVIVVPMIWRRIDGKYDKFISPEEALEVISDAVIDPNEKNSILSKKDRETFWNKSLF